MAEFGVLNGLGVAGSLLAGFLMHAPLLGILGTLIGAEKIGSIAELRFLLAWKLRRRDVTLGPYEATLSYNRFLKALQKKGFRKPPSQTPREFATSFIGTRMSWEVLEFTRLYNALRFGQARVPLARLRALLDEIAGPKQ